MRGKKINDDLREQARALLAINNNVTDVAKQLNLAPSTLRTWARQWKESDEFVKLRHEKKEKFVADAWDCISKAMAALKLKLETAVKQNDSASIKELAVAIGTLYDKQALANNESTDNVTVQRKWEDFV